MQFWSLLGNTDYQAVSRLQLKLVELRASELIPDTVLFLEHEPVITRGRGLQFTGAPRVRQMPLPSQLPSGIKFSESERGGDLTYHGPGQLVVYPIQKLEKRDVAEFIRGLEKKVMLLLERHLLEQQGPAEKCLAPPKVRTVSDATGVWIGDRKIASLGIAVRKWVTYHGVAINIVNDLRPFHLISPCGFNPEVMTCLSDWSPVSPRWRSDWEKGLAESFFPTATIRELTLQEALLEVERLGRARVFDSRHLSHSGAGEARSE